ncbi:hypothetical protein ACFLU2_01800 [Chloroflexota bacterium]
MSNWAVVYALGVTSGLVIGLIVGRKQKPWSELSENQKKLMTGLIATGVVLLVAATIVASLLIS